MMDKKMPCNFQKPVRENDIRELPLPEDKNKIVYYFCGMKITGECDGDNCIFMQILTRLKQT